MSMTAVPPTARSQQLREEFIDVINEIYPDDLLDTELAALTSILRGAIERRDRLAPVLQLVRPGNA